MRRRSSDLTCLQAFSLLSAVSQQGRFDPALPFFKLLEEYGYDRPEGSDAPRQPVGDGQAHAAGAVPRATGLPSGSAGESASRRERAIAEAEAATVVVTPPHHSFGE
jgi:hypothetical protein